MTPVEFQLETDVPFSYTRRSTTVEVFSNVLSSLENEENEKEK